MYPLAKEIKEILDEKGININGTITTNGYLINRERINKFKEIGLTNFQITLDGNQKTHDKIRFGKNREGSFYTIMDNINLLVEEMDANVSVRINYTRKTLIDVNEIIDLFSEKTKSKIIVLFQQVWQDSIKENVSADENKKEFEKRGIKVRKHELNNNFHVCYADKEQQVIINHDGKVFKCTARDFNENFVQGELQSSGEIQWNIPAVSKRFGKYTFENEFCLKCNLLPACMGPCSQKMVELPEKFDAKFFRQMCLQDGVRKVIEQNMEEHYNSIANLKNDV
ncbi:MAG: SPASM domain-containing protein [Streptococcaceae bacterium]|nr:SPASM domain-containing protein [Streptococcaceae bacterium]